MKSTPYVWGKIFRNFLRAKIKGEDRLRFVEIIVDFACNGRCEFCSNKLMTKGKKKLDLEKIKSIIDECAAYDVPLVGILGGEPFLFKDLEEIVAYCRKKRVLSLISSNGSLIREEKLRRLKELGLTMLVVSLHSADPDKSDKIHGIGGTFNNAVKMLKYAKKIELTTQVALVVSPETIESGDLIKLGELTKSIGATLSINLTIPVGGVHNDYSILLNDKQFKILKDYCDRNTHVGLDLYNNYKGYCCSAGHTYLTITPYGDVMPCFFIPISFGNLWEESLMKIHKRILKQPVFKQRCKFCLGGESKEFIKRFLDPVYDKANKYIPIPYKKHPCFNKKNNCLDDLRIKKRNI